ncbi:MAG: hypothetical protein ABII00_07640 [Elusimicrobiota bacterium]
MAVEPKTPVDDLLAKTLDRTREDDPIREEHRTPPSRGICRRCGQDKPVNQLMLCYRCWVITNLEESGWREGMPHPGWCQCQGLGGHSGHLGHGN